VAEELERRSGQQLEQHETADARIPPGVDLQDGLSENEAVAIALANNADFHARLAALGVSAADVQRAQLLPNPSIAAVFGQTWEATLTYPIDLMWKRPRRVRVAETAYAAQIQHTVQSGLDLILATRLAYVDAEMAQRRAQLAEAAAERASRVGRISRSRVESGDASGLDARSAEAEAGASVEAALRTRVEYQIAENTLRRLTRLDTSSWPGTLQRSAEQNAAAMDADQLIAFALDTRPDIRAAALDLEAAGARIGLARAEALSIASGVKATGSGNDTDFRPAATLPIPLFDRGQAEAMAARARAQQAAYAYAGLRDQVTFEVTDATVRLAQANSSLHAWRDEMVPSIEDSLRRSERAYAAGDVPYLIVLDNLRRLLDAQTAEADASGASRRAAAALARHVGGALPEPAMRKDP
jgi:cobalt-zinc-cadmium efflux system outer membrane protein